MVSTSTELAPYKVVFAPALNILAPTSAQRLIEYALNGGTLVPGPRSGMKNVDNGLQSDGQPVPLISVLGARVEPFYALDAPVPLQGGGTATVWAEPLFPLDPTANVLRRFASGTGWLSEKSAVIKHDYGRGRALYIGAHLDQDTLRDLLLPLLEQANIHPLLPDQPASVEVMQRSAPNRTVWILLNHSDHEQHVSLAHPMRNLLDSTWSGTAALDLGAHAVAVLLPER